MAYSVYDRPSRSARVTILWLVVTSIVLTMFYFFLTTRNDKVKTFTTNLVIGETATDEGP
jgi:hypothetical protein